MNANSALSAVRRLLMPLVWLILTPAALCAAALVLRPQEWAPRAQTDLQSLTIYAYRQWQSTGVDLKTGDQYVIQAAGDWLYSPFVGRHGPEGGGKPVTVPTYPLPRVDGGALLGRIGDAGEIFYVGRGTGGFAEAAGRLYLRINDDLLGDNVGQLAIAITVIPAATPAP